MCRLQAAESLCATRRGRVTIRTAATIPAVFEAWHVVRFGRRCRCPQPRTTKKAVIRTLEHSNRTTCSGHEHAVTRQIRDRFQNSSYPEIRRLDCAFADGVLLVRGRLASFYLKQVAWSLIVGAANFDHFDDQIEVAL